MTTCRILTPTGYVHSFNEQHLVVATCSDARKAKTFPDRPAAERFLHTHADVGYGLVRATAEISEEAGP